jgi:hypothetical protein
MPGKKISLLGSNLHTNSTNVFGSMAGAAPTVGVRPHITGINGYNKGVPVNLPKDALASGCGRNKNRTDNMRCAKFLPKKAFSLYRPSRDRVILH